MAAIRDTLSREERAELDALLQRLSPDEADLVRLVEIFMNHQVGQALLFNEEVRETLARQGADLADHELRLRALARDIARRRL